jgi:hypothetical protein
MPIQPFSLIVYPILVRDHLVLDIPVNGLVAVYAEGNFRMEDSFLCCG